MQRQAMQFLVRFSFVISCAVLSLPQTLGDSMPEEVTRSTATQTKQLLQDAQAANDCRDFWTDYFAQKNIDPIVVHDVVRQLSKEMRTKKEYADQIVALIESAILSGNSQPWMYEALTLTLHFKGAPKAQVARAALSAADFCNDPIDLLNIGFVLRTALDLKEHAFPLYQQALENMPPRREFYAATLRLAEELFRENDDEESLRWIGLAIISQEWDGALGKKLTQDADDALKTLGNRMTRQGRNEEKQQLDKEIREAKLRDCVVIVEWTGDAGVDLMVREPSGSMCWFKAPRSISGGLLKTSQAMAPARINSQSDAKRISYVCPQGFNGVYTLVLHKSWGNLPSNLLNVSVETNVVLGESKNKGVAVPLDSDGAMVQFVLDSGRRTETVSEAELAAADLQARAAQQTVDRNMVLRRLADDGLLGQAADPSGQGTVVDASGGDGGAATQIAIINELSGGTPVVTNPDIDSYFYGSRYVGYQPVIELIGVGSSLFLGPGQTAVSPDRRYLLMRLDQGFSTLRSVQEFSPVSSGGGGNNIINQGNNTGGQGGRGGIIGAGGFGGGGFGGFGW